ncbi:forkhead box protein O3 [Sarotherodon galilaeus]
MRLMLWHHLDDAPPPCVGAAPERHSVGLCSRRRSFFSSPCPLLFFVTILHGRLRDGPLGLWEPSPLLGSALFPDGSWKSVDEG